MADKKGYCPMTEEVPLNEKQVKKFCDLGCSVDCPKFLDEYLIKLGKEPMEVKNA